MNHIVDPSTNVDRSVDSSVSTTLTPEVNINTATAEAAVSTTLDVLPSVPEPGNTAIKEDSVSTTKEAISTTLDVSSSVPEQGKLATDNTKPAPVGQPFLFSQLIQNMISPCVHLATKKIKSGSIVIGLKTKIGNAGYTTMQKKMQLFVLLA